MLPPPSGPGAVLEATTVSRRIHRPSKIGPAMDVQRLTFPRVVLLAADQPDPLWWRVSKDLGLAAPSLGRAVGFTPSFAIAECCSMVGTLQYGQ
jgi:hypothetical protein